MKTCLQTFYGKDNNTKGFRTTTQLRKQILLTEMLLLELLYLCKKKKKKGTEHDIQKLQDSY